MSSSGKRWPVAGSSKKAGDVVRKMVDKAKDKLEDCKDTLEDKMWDAKDAYELERLRQKQKPKQAPEADAAAQQQQQQQRQDASAVGPSQTWANQAGPSPPPSAAVFQQPGPAAARGDPPEPFSPFQTLAEESDGGAAAVGAGGSSSRQYSRASSAASGAKRPCTTTEHLLRTRSTLTQNKSIDLKEQSPEDVVQESHEHEWLSELLEWLWPYLRAAANREVCSVVGPLLGNIPPFVAHVLLPGKGIVAVPLHGFSLALRLMDMLGPNPPRVRITRVYQSPSGTTCLDWRLTYNMASAVAASMEVWDEEESALARGADPGDVSKSPSPSSTISRSSSLDSIASSSVAYRDGGPAHRPAGMAYGRGVEGGGPAQGPRGGSAGSGGGHSGDGGEEEEEGWGLERWVSAAEEFDDAGFNSGEEQRKTGGGVSGGRAPLVAGQEPHQPTQPRGPTIRDLLFDGDMAADHRSAAALSSPTTSPWGASTSGGDLAASSSRVRVQAVGVKDGSVGGSGGPSAAYLYHDTAAGFVTSRAQGGFGEDPALAEHEPLNTDGIEGRKSKDSVLATCAMQAGIDIGGSFQINMRTWVEVLRRLGEVGMAVEDLSVAQAAAIISDPDMWNQQQRQQHEEGEAVSGTAAAAEQKKGKREQEASPIDSDDTWMNQLLAALWPRLRVLSVPFLRQLALKVINSFKPYWVAEMRIRSLDLGNIPPRLHSVRVFSDDHDSTPDVMLDFDLEWAAKDFFAEVEVQTMSKRMMRYLPERMQKAITGLLTFRGGVRDLQLKAKLRMMVRPLLPRLPVIGCVQMSLVGLPEFDMDLTCYGGEMWMLGPIKSWLVRVARDCLLGQYIYPDTLNIPIDQSVRPINPPEGLLEVTVVEARNIPQDSWIMRAGTNMFVELWVSKSWKRRTQSMPGVAPRYNQASSTFAFPVHVIRAQELKVVCWDQSGLAVEELGRATIPMPVIDQLGGSFDFWIRVARPSKDGQPSWTVAMPQPGPVSSHFMVHLRGTWLKFDEAMISAMVQCQMEGPLRFLRSPTGAASVLPREVRSRILDGGFRVVVQAARHLGVPSGKRVHATVRLARNTASFMQRYTSKQSVTFAKFLYWDVDIGMLQPTEPIDIDLRTTSGKLLGKLSTPLLRVVDRNVAGWHPLRGGRTRQAAVMIWLTWEGFFD